MADAEVAIAEVNSWQKSLILMLTPLPALTSTPYWLMRKVTTSQETPAIVIWTAPGIPSLKITSSSLTRIFKNSSFSWKSSFLPNK